jgi:hypothetical protein
MLMITRIATITVNGVSIVVYADNETGTTEINIASPTKLVVSSKKENTRLIIIHEPEAVKFLDQIEKGDNDEKE